MSDLRTIFEENADRVAAAVAKADPSIRPVAESVAMTLGKAGIHADDMPDAMRAVARIVRDSTMRPVDPTSAAEFVAHAAALGNLRGPELPLIHSLALTARRMF